MSVIIDNFKIFRYKHKKGHLKGGLFQLSYIL
nr:MAG TPA: hypothetical protein [Caudoviricetes sp.]